MGQNIHHVHPSSLGQSPGCALSDIVDVFEHCRAETGECSPLTNCTVRANSFHRKCIENKYDCKTIEILKCKGKEVGHAANLVKVDGKWCLADATFGSIHVPCFTDPQKIPKDQLCSVMGYPAETTDCGCEVITLSSSPIVPNVHPDYCLQSGENAYFFKNLNCRDCCANQRQHLLTKKKADLQKVNLLFENCKAACNKRF